MLVKVKHKETGRISHITPKAYDLAKKRYQHLGTVTDNDANLHGSTTDTFKEPVSQFSSPEEPPNQQPQAEKESGAAPAADNPVVIKPAKGKPGPKPKKQISSPATTDEV